MSRLQDNALYPALWKARRGQLPQNARLGRNDRLCYTAEAVAEPSCEAQRYLAAILQCCVARYWLVRY